MQVRITFRAEVFIDGKDLDEISQKWQELALFSEDAEKEGAQFIETVSAERVDDDSYKDVVDEIE